MEKGKKIAKMTKNEVRDKFAKVESIIQHLEKLREKQNVTQMYTPYSQTNSRID